MSNPTELPDLDKLEALAKAATPGEWKAMPHGRVVGGPLRHYVNGSSKAQIASFGVTFHEQAPEDEPERQQANAEFCAAANPAAVLALIALARRAQPEGEAPQAEPVAYITSDKRMLVFADRVAGNDHGMTPLYAAATLSPLCGDQHAESGAPDKNFHMEYRRGYAAAKADFAAQQAAAPADCSGTPSSCPDNEGYGCHCSAPGTPEAPKGGAA